MKPSLEAALRLDHPAYLQTARRGFAGNVHRVSVLTARSATAAMRLLRRHMPEATKVDHALLAAAHARSAAAHRDAWSAVADAAATRLWGRPFRVSDYRISAIGRDEFTDWQKDALRRLARARSAHHTLAIVHHMAAGHRHATAIAYCQAAGL